MNLDCPRPDPHPRPATFPIAPGACDCHAHVIGPSHLHPFVHDRAYTPPDALLPDYLHVVRMLGLQRIILVQPSMHGTDNTVMLNALRDARAEGIQGYAIAGVEEDCSEEDLQRLHDRGVRGIRLNMIYGGGNAANIGAAAKLAGKLAPLGWCLELLLDVSHFGANLTEFDDLGVPLVMDHFGHMAAHKGPDDPGFRALIELVERGNTWVKLSGSYRLAGDTDFRADVKRLARALVEADPERMLWGTDWPHTLCSIPMPNDGDLLNLLADWVPDPTTRTRILVHNPAALYGFEAGKSGGTE
ncbi:MAG: amidohydrolase [Pseudorhodoplanes sp.]|uniref:amidohydrolase family protein n=1 Tax=Pseudorhodoplanes sp. TaxID=1934341 RepID=UPI003D0E1617